MVPTACLVLFIPFFFVSSWSEGFIVTKFLKDYDKFNVKKVTWKANLASYAFLYVIVFGLLIFSLLEGSPREAYHKKNPLPPYYLRDRNAG
jgi:hypothetical protein